MGVIQSLNERKNNLSVWDIGLIKWSVFCGTIVIVKLIPAILNISIWVFVILTILLVSKPLYVFWFKESVENVGIS